EWENGDQIICPVRGDHSWSYVRIKPAASDKPLCGAESPVAARACQQRIPLRGNACDRAQFLQHFVLDFSRVKCLGAKHLFSQSAVRSGHPASRFPSNSTKSRAVGTLRKLVSAW